MTIRVLVADDHPAFRAGLRLMLATADDIEVVGEAENGTQAVTMATDLAPDVVVMDLRMPGLDGIEATRRVLVAHPDTGVVVLTMFEDDESVFAAMRAGARGYVLKGAEQDEILRSIRAIAAGEAIFGPSIARLVVEHFATGTASAKAAFPSLTEREREVLEQMAQGKNNAAIARSLFLTERAVEKHINSLFHKLGLSEEEDVHRRVMAVLAFLREGGTLPA